MEADPVMDVSSAAKLYKVGQLIGVLHATAPLR
ncbi:hypothetical protein F443_08966 [Phytophthora nicotianae P1569]|uniref:Uncharacterized protein n=1 Tax=Phytophthora nicotianae P1569 TaxID=1317065 RepID=V9F551_PHYNI|nr:hypothetical protein F443_08966 [Phytophthora nicotianae P1569]